MWPTRSAGRRQLTHEGSREELRQGSPRQGKRHDAHRVINPPEAVKPGRQLAADYAACIKVGPLTADPWYDALLGCSRAGRTHLSNSSYPSRTAIGRSDRGNAGGLTPQTRLSLLDDRC